MDGSERCFGPEKHDIPPDLKAKMEETERILRESWKLKKIEEELVYEITIPGQKLTVFGKEGGERTLERLKRLKISGTYKIINRSNLSN